MPSLGRTAVFVISFSIVSFLAIQFTLFGFGRISAYKSRLSDDPAAAIGARTTANPAPDHSEQTPFHVLQPAQQQSAAAHPSLPLPPSSPNVDTAPALEEAYVAVLDAAFSPQAIVARAAPAARAHACCSPAAGCA